MSSILASGAVVLALTAAFSALLGVARRRLWVEEDPRVAEVQAVLPAANCGGCGYAGCAEFARAVVAGRAPVTGCTAGNHSTAGEVAAVMGVEVVPTHRFRPVIHCGARTADRLGRAPSDGIATCLEADLVGTTQGCVWGCLGLGDCVAACEHDALHMRDGLPVVDYARCTGCGACVDACPRRLIEQIPFKRERMLVIACANPEPGKAVREVCRVGCIGCNICERLAPDVFAVSENLARIDYHRQTGDEDVSEALERCPAEVMVYFGPPPARGAAAGEGAAPAATGRRSA